MRDVVHCLSPCPLAVSVNEFYHCLLDVVPSQLHTSVESSHSCCEETEAETFTRLLFRMCFYSALYAQTSVVHC